ASTAGSVPTDGWPPDGWPPDGWPPDGWNASAARRPNASTILASTAGSAPSAVSSPRICATAKSSTAAADPPRRLLVAAPMRAILKHEKQQPRNPQPPHP